MTTFSPAPLTFTPVVLEKVWGGRRLGALGKSLPKPAAAYGESWELADMSSTSASGAGGSAVRTVIEAGPHAGMTLADVLARFGDAVVPRAMLSPKGEFPLLIKFLDARENLSVQVHPSPAFAASNPGAHLKTECWYIVDAEPGAGVYIGLKPGVTLDDLARASRAGDAGIGDMLERHDALPGRMFNLPSGTVHAIGAGVLVAETQLASDTTFRLFDWGRPGRELHIEQAIACTLDDPAPTFTMLAPGEEAAELVRTDAFIVREHRVRPGARVRLKAPCIIVGVGGAARVAGSSTVIGLGRTALIPAAMGDVELATEPGTGGEARVLVVDLVPRRKP